MKMREKAMETLKKMFDGDVSLKKRELWMVGGLCLLAGIVYGLRKAPWTHGVSIGSNNVNHGGDTYNHVREEEDCCCHEEDWDEEDCFEEEDCCCRK